MKGSEFARQRRRPLAESALPDLTTLIRAVSRVTNRWPDVVRVPDLASRDQLTREMLRRVEQRDWASVQTQRVTAAAFAAFDRERRDVRDFEPLRDFYLREILTSDSRTFLSGMFRVYLDSFAPAARHTTRLAQALRQRNPEELGRDAASLLRQIPEVLTPARAAAALSDLMVASDDPYSALREAGVRTPHMRGLTYYAHLAFVERIAAQLDRESEQERLLRWLKPPQVSAALQGGATEAVAALLAPWRDRSPAEKMQSRLTEAIIAAYGDPRLVRGGIWAAFPQTLMGVLLRWLTKADMRLFCDVITATQRDHQWQPRRDFWLQLFEDRRIDEAWVAFGSAAQSYAERHLSRSATALRGRFARQTDRGGSTSLLIMRIGNKIVVDGCHSYKTHIFEMRDERAPRLYQSTYECDAIRVKSRMSKPHNSIPVWRQWVEQHI